MALSTDDSGSSGPLLVVSNLKLTTALQTIARLRLTQKQKQILRDADALREELPITRFVQRCSGGLSCAETTIWSNIQQLRDIGLLNYGDRNTKGKPVRITVLGRLICHKLEE